MKYIEDELEEELRQHSLKLELLQSLIKVYLHGLMDEVITEDNRDIFTVGHVINEYMEIIKSNFSEIENKLNL